MWNRPHAVVRTFEVNGVVTPRETKVFPDMITAINAAIKDFDLNRRQYAYKYNVTYRVENLNKETILWIRLYLNNRLTLPIQLPYTSQRTYHKLAELRGFVKSWMVAADREGLIDISNYVANKEEAKPDRSITLTHHNPLGVGKDPDYRGFKGAN